MAAVAVNGGPVNGDPIAAGLEGPQQGKVKGVIVPPPDIRAIADKTARFVAKNGKDFETRILASEEGKSAKFNFMKPHDPYYAYYEWKIRDFEENGDAAMNTPAPSTLNSKDAGDKEEISAAPVSVAAAVQKKAVVAPIAKAAKNISRDVAPHPFEFTSGHPSTLTSLDVDMIKLTAQYTAAGGRQFLATLAKKEANNERFQFLKHTHALFSYFTSLVDAYSKVLQPTDAQKKNVHGAVTEQGMLERAVHRWEYDRASEERKKAQEAEVDAAKLAFRSIDWHDFVVVETIDFPADELTDVTFGPADEDMDIDMEEEVDTEDEKQEEKENSDIEESDDEDKPPLPPMEEEEEEVGQEGMPEPGYAERERQREEEDQDIDVVEDYQYQVATSSAASAIPQTAIDPITGRAVPLSQLSDHMRIQLMDPRWREQQAVALSRQKETAFAEGESIARNLQAFARKRTDIFGSAEEEEAAMLAEAAQRAGRMEEANRIIFNDQSAQAAAQREREQLERQKQLQAQVTPQPYRPAAPISIPAPRQPQPPLPSAMPPLPSGPMPPLPPATSTYSSSTYGGQPPLPSGDRGMPPLPPGPMPPLPTSGAVQPPLPSMPPPPVQRPAAPWSQPAPPAHAPRGQGTWTAPPVVDELIPEGEFSEKFGDGSTTIVVQCPDDDSAEVAGFGLKGQALTVELDSVMASVKDLKASLAPMLGNMPPNKQQLKDEKRGFLKDNLSLAHYNLSAGAVLELVPRKRGGR